MDKVIFLAFVITIYFTNIMVSVRGCSDTSTECYRYARFCNHQSYIAFTRQSCKKTCRFCAMAGPCQDVRGYQARCRQYKANNYCKLYTQSMAVYCKRTCALCGTAVHGMWSPWSDWGECARPCGKAQQIRSRKCKNPPPSNGGRICEGEHLDAKDCNIKPCSAGCSNVKYWDRSCSGWQKTGECNGQNRIFMALNCKKSCNLCSVVVKPSCRTNKGGCMHKCAVVTNKIKCSCNAGYTLMKDKKRCAKANTMRTCGRDKDVFSIGRIVGGVNAVAHRWEWQGGMYYYGEFVCGGSLIARNLFLTAAHCVIRRTEASEMFIRMGDHNRYEDDAGEQDIKVKKIIKHQDWDRNTVLNDIALLQLEDNAKITETVGTVCLPTANINPRKDSTCYITGWGKTGILDWEADILQEAKLPIIPNDECGRRNVDKKKISRIRPEMICGGYKDPKIEISGCMGDSGGPYVCKDDKKWVLQGLVSWGSNQCNGTHRFTVFTRVNKYIDWINTQKKTLI